MHAQSFKVAVCAMLFAMLPTASHALTVVSSGSDDSARVIVKFRAAAPPLRAQALSPSGRSATRALALGERQGVAVTVGEAVSELSSVLFAAGMSSADLAQRLARDADVEYAVPDERKFLYTAPNDPLYATGAPGTGPAAGQWYLRASAGAVQSSLDVETAWNVTTGNPGIVVADVDSGVRYEHPDLLSVAAGGNLLPGYDMVSDPTYSSDGLGRHADASDPGDWITQAELSNRNGPYYQCRDVAESSSWHGTQVSGLIAALTDNGVGMASVGRTVRLLPVRVFGKCGAFDSDVLAGFRWAAGLAVPGVPANPYPAKVINFSGGGPGACNAAYVDAVAEIAAVGTVIVASAGNSEGQAVSTPANCSGVIAVAGLRHVGTKVGFSSLGPEVAISAPGGNCVNTAAGAPCLYPILSTSNSGTTVPVSSIYTDSYNPTLGTSFSSPLVAATAALVLSVQPTFTPAQVRQVLQATASPFPASGSDSGAVPQCTAPQYDAAGHPISQDECYCTSSTCGAGMLNAGAAVLAASAGLPSADFEVEGLWWNAPANSESGWGINLARQGSVIFATWFTYDANGRAWWLSMTATKTGLNTYAGTLYQTHGPAFSAMPFDPTEVTSTSVGSGTLAFTDANNGTFSYTVNGITQLKSITRELFGTPPTCVFALHPPLATASNYEDLWWNAPGGSEAGWGINLTEQSGIIFATWFTYDIDGAPLWLSGTATNTGPGAYAGTLYRANGPAFNAVPFDPASVKLVPVGNLALTFADGNDATFAYTVNGVAQTKAITRQVFRTPGTECM